MCNAPPRSWYDGNIAPRSVFQFQGTNVLPSSILDCSNPNIHVSEVIHIKKMNGETWITAKFEATVSDQCDDFREILKR